MSALSVLAVSLLADSGESKKSGPIGLAVILVLCVACYFLFKSMSKHLRKVREEFPAPGVAPTDGLGHAAQSGEVQASTDAPSAPSDQPPAQPLA